SRRLTTSRRCAAWCWTICRARDSSTSGGPSGPSIAPGACSTATHGRMPSPSGPTPRDWMRSANAWPPGWTYGARRAWRAGSGGTPENPRPYYALGNTDRGHDVSWLAIENDKGPSRVPAQIVALVVQMSGAFSAAHFDAAPEHLAAMAAAAASSVLGLDFRRP